MAEAGSQEEKAFSTLLWENFDGVVKRLSDGRTDVKLMSSFLRERAKTEEAYAKSLQVTSKQNPFLAKCSAAPCWQEIVNSEVSLYKQHSQFAVACNGFADKLDSYATEIKNQKLQSEKTHARILKDRNAKNSTHKKTQETYAQRVAAAESAINDLSAGKLNAVNSKQLLKLDQGAARAVQSCGLAHESYRTAVSDLEQSQRMYDTELNNILDAFQNKEKRRINLICETATKYNQFQGFIENALKQLSLLSTNLDKIDSDQDIKDFVKESASKNERPGYVEYKQVESQLIDEYKPGQFGVTQNSPKSSKHSPKSSTKRLKNPSNAEAKPSDAPVGPVGPSTSVDAEATIAPPAPPATTQASFPALDYATALFTFQTEDAENLHFEAGAKIKLTKCPEGEDWWEGELEGKHGMFPQSYVKVTRHGSIEDLTSVESQYKTLTATCTTTFKFEGQDDDELSFEAGESLMIEKDMDGWYLGRNAKGEMGIFPANYIKMDEVASADSETAGSI